jgi:hypothetical protein
MNAYIQKTQNIREAQETQKLLRQLELATSQEAIDDTDVDPETRPLREGWLVLDRLLQSPADFRLIRPASLPPQATNSRLIQRCVMAVSALLLLVMICGSFVVTSSGPELTTQAANEHDTAANNINSAATENHSSSFLESNSELAWEDSFDHQLAAASLAIRRTGEGSEVSEWHFLHGELLEISDELKRSSL